MTYDQAVQFLRVVCAERIQSLTEGGALATAEALGIRCELAFSVIRQSTEQGQEPPK